MNDSHIIILLKQLEDIGENEYAFQVYERIINHCTEKTMVAEAHLGIARIMYNIGFFERAREIATDLLNSKESFSVTLGATMILETLECDKANN